MIIMKTRDTELIVAIETWTYKVATHSDESLWPLLQFHAFVIFTQSEDQIAWRLQKHQMAVGVISFFRIALILLHSYVKHLFRARTSFRLNMKSKKERVEGTALQCSF